MSKQVCSICGKQTHGEHEWCEPCCKAALNYDRDQATIKALTEALEGNVNRVAELEAQLPLIGISKRADDLVLLTRAALALAKGA